MFESRDTLAAPSIFPSVSVPQLSTPPMLHHLQTQANSGYPNRSDPPDLYATLRDEPADPPPEDFHPSDPDLVPQARELDFYGDLYTPRWVRGQVKKREGWCGFCTPGHWLALSDVWDHPSLTHGVSPVTKSRYQEP
jgi:hypothetical protein